MKLFYIILISLLSLSFIDGIVIDNIRSKSINGKDSVIYLVRNYTTILSGNVGYETWEHYGHIVVDSVSIDYYRIIVITNNKNKFKEVSFIFSYIKSVNKSNLLRVIIDGVSYKKDSVDFDKLINDVKINH